MKKIILYIGLAIALLAIVFALNGAYAAVQNDIKAAEQNAEAIFEDSLVLSSGLPVIYVETNGQDISKDQEVFVEISVYETYEVTAETHPETMDAVIKYRGSSSYLTFDKKQYRIEFRAEEGSEKNEEYSIMNLPAASDWVLNGPFLDRTLSRNYLGYTVSRMLLPWAPDTEYCELYIDGEYQGLYLLVEPVTNEAGRLNLSDYSLVSGRCSYIARFDIAEAGETALETYGEINCTVTNDVILSYPSPSNLTYIQKEYVTNDISEFEQALCSDYFDDPEIGYAKYINVDSFVDYFIISEMMMITDGGYFSTYFYKDLAPGSKIEITVWDFNNSFDNMPWYLVSYEEFHLVDSNWFKRLVQDENFVDKVVTRYHELRQGVLSDETLIGMLDENVEYIGSAAERNFELWGYTFNEHLMSGGRDPESFEEAVSMLKEAIKMRGAYLDENIESLYEYCIN